MNEEGNSADGLRLRGLYNWWGQTEAVGYGKLRLGVQERTVRKVRPTEQPIELRRVIEGTSHQFIWKNACPCLLNICTT